MKKKVVNIDKKGATPKRKDVSSIYSMVDEIMEKKEGIVILAIPTVDKDGDEGIRLHTMIMKVGGEALANALGNTINMIPAPHRKVFMSLVEEYANKKRSKSR